VGGAYWEPTFATPRLCISKANVILKEEAEVFGFHFVEPATDHPAMFVATGRNNVEVGLVTYIQAHPPGARDGHIVPTVGVVWQWEELQEPFQPEWVRRKARLMMLGFLGRLARWEPEKYDDPSVKVQRDVFSVHDLISGKW
jgi:hypothetical protein